MRLNKVKYYETSVSIYDTAKQYEEDYYENIDLLTKKCVGNMLPIEHYAIQLYANGRIVKLEIPNGRYRHWSALISDSKEYGKSEWPIMLYRPQGSKDFVIIRK